MTTIYVKMAPKGFCWKGGPVRRWRSGFKTIEETARDADKAGLGLPARLFMSSHDNV